MYVGDMDRCKRTYYRRHCLQDNGGWCESVGHYMDNTLRTVTVWWCVAMETMTCHCFPVTILAGNVTLPVATGQWTEPHTPTCIWLVLSTTEWHQNLMGVKILSSTRVYVAWWLHATRYAYVAIQIYYITEVMKIHVLVSIRPCPWVFWGVACSHGE